MFVNSFTLLNTVDNIAVNVSCSFLMQTVQIQIVTWVYSYRSKEKLVHYFPQRT